MLNASSQLISLSCFLFYSILALQVVVFLITARVHTLLLASPRTAPTHKGAWTLLQAQEDILEILQYGVDLVLGKAIS